LIKGLILVAALRSDADILVAGNEAVDQVDGDVALVMILENQPPAGAALRQVGFEVELNLAYPLPHLLQRGEACEDEVERHGLVVDLNKEIFQHTLRICLLLGLGERTVAVDVHTCDDGRGDGNARDEAH